MRRLLLNPLILLAALLLSALGTSANSGIKLIENKGQWKSNVRFQAYIPGGTFYVENQRLTYFFYDLATLHAAMHDHKNIDSIKCHVIHINFKNALLPEAIATENPSFESYNYIHGKDPSKWASGAKAFEKITLKNLWHLIDMEIGVSGDAIKYNFIVHPGAHASDIQLAYEGAGKTYLENSCFHINTSLTHIKEEKPKAYQLGSEDKVGVKCSYKLNKDVLSFNIANYNPKVTLVIDPLVIFATFSGSYADNFGFTGTYDHQGCGYSGGTVFGTGFPTTTGAFEEKYQGGYTDLTDPSGYITDFGRDIGILKYTPDGKKLVWATYLGGSNNEQPHSMIVNKDGELVVLGTTYSNDFPVTSGAYASNYSGNGDMFVCKLSKDGSTLNASTYIGGTDKDGLNGQYNFNLNGTDGPLAYNYGDHFRGEVLIDSNNNIYVASCTRSSDFPTSNGFQSSLNGTQDACIIKFKSDLSGLYWSTLLGGADEDAAYGINIDTKGNIFVTGGTMSNDFPVSSAAYNRSYGGNADGFLAKISADGKSLLAATYVGTAYYDQSYLVQIDKINRVFIAGQTKGTYPVIGTVYSNTGGKQFISAFSDDLSKMTLSTVFGSGRPIPDISPSAFLVDNCGRICMSGWGGAVNYEYNGEDGKTIGLTTTQDAVQKSTDGSDFYLIVFGKDLSSLVYASYYGGDAGSYEHVDGGTSRFDVDGKVYQSVCGGCGGYSDFPTTPGAWSRTNNGIRPKPLKAEGGCNNAMFKMDLNTSNYPPTMRDTTLMVYASSQFSYQFELTDRDVKDSIYVSYYGSAFDPKLTKGTTAKINVQNGGSKVYGTLQWLTSCNQIGVDTYYVYFGMHDNGCPTQKSSVGLIKLVLIPPLPVSPPGIFCIHRSDKKSVTINWSDYPNVPYLKYYRLVKVLPNGSMHIVKTFNEQVDNSYVDDSVPDNLNNNYCYFIYGVNTCGVIGDSTRFICSAVPNDSMPAAINIYSVSVVNNRSIKVIWHQSHQKDFYMYKLYRKRNISNEDYVLTHIVLKDPTDTVFEDQDVDVQNISYTYKIVMVTQCGLMSNDGRVGRSIVLSGSVVPFENHLQWNPYQDWINNVSSYAIYRSDTGAELSYIYPVSGAFNETIDDSLNYNWGLYYYKVIARETNSDAFSESNIIQLIQKPILYAANVFTPNADSLNDTWYPSLAFVKNIHIKIFNRWGTQVWENTDKKARWPGKFLNDKPYNNVFIWQAEYIGWDGGVNYKLGNITILK